MPINSRRHFDFADWWALCPEQTQAASSRKKLKIGDTLTLMGFVCCDVRSCSFCVKRFGDKQFGLVVHFWVLSRFFFHEDLAPGMGWWVRFLVSCAHSLAAERTQNTPAPSKWISIRPPCSAQWCWLFETVRTVLYVHDALSNFQVFQCDNWEFENIFLEAVQHLCSNKFEPAHEKIV